MTNEELILELQARAYREVHGRSLPGDGQPLQAAQPPAQAPAEVAPPPPAPALPPQLQALLAPAPQVPLQLQALLATAQSIQQAPLQAGRTLVPRPQLPAGTVAAIDFVQAQQAAAPPTPKPPTFEERWAAAVQAHKAELAKQPPPVVPGFTGGFLAKPQFPRG